MPPAPVPPENPTIGFCHSHRTAVPFVLQSAPNNCRALKRLLMALVMSRKENKTNCVTCRDYAYTGKAKDLLLVVLPSDLSERLPEYAMGPE